MTRPDGRHRAPGEPPEPTDHQQVSPPRRLAAGEFASWATAAQAAIRHGGSSDVPCGGCTACCTSWQFVHIGPEETDTLAHIPAELLFPAPHLTAGHFVLGYDTHGRCPMLSEGGCSIYEHRPRTCRTYDCRVFPAAGVMPEARQATVAARAARWRFDYPGAEDRQRQEAVRKAASFLQSHPDALPDGASVANPTQLAALSVAAHEVFMPPLGTPGRTTEADPAAVRAVLGEADRSRPATAGTTEGESSPAQPRRRRISRSEARRKPA